MAPPLGARLTADLTFLATCWRLVRRDGVALGFTAHDRPLAIAGLRYDSAPGMAASAVVADDSFEIDTLEVSGALTASGLNDADLALGRWDGARVELFLVDWRSPDAGRQPLAAGTLGTVAAGIGADRGFVATLMGPQAALAVDVVPVTSPECRAELGDRRCRMALRPLVRTGIVTAAGAAGDPRIDGVGPVHSGGRLRVLGGPLTGIDRQIVAVVDGAVQLDEPLVLAVGTPVALTEGCDRRFATCRDRFGNAANFRGEPHVPGSDLLIRFGSN